MTQHTLLADFIIKIDFKMIDTMELLKVKTDNYTSFIYSHQILLYISRIVGCRSNGTVLVTCHAAPNVTCSNITEYDPDEVVFCREEKCRYV